MIKSSNTVTCNLRPKGWKFKKALTFRLSQNLSRVMDAAKRTDVPDSPSIRQAQEALEIAAAGTE